MRRALLETRGLGRRALLKALAGSGALALLPFPAAAAEPPVTAFVFGGVWKKSAMQAFGEPFTKRTGIPIVYQDPYTFAKLRAMHEAKAMQVDVVSVQGGEMFQAKRMNMLMPLDFSVIDRTALSERQLRHGNAIGGHTLSHVICYNKKKWPGEHHPTVVGRFLGRAEISRPPRAASRGGLEHRGRAHGRRRQGAASSTRSTSVACSAASTASSRTSRPGTPTIRWPSN